MQYSTDHYSMKARRTADKPTYYIQSLDRALDVLESFSYQERELDLSQLIKRTGLNRTTVRRILNHLLRRNYVNYKPETKRYQLGVKLFELGGVVFSSLSLRKVAGPHLTRLRDETGQTVLLGVEMEEHLVYVDKRDGRGLIRVSSDIGWRRPLHFGMLGMVLMSDMPQKRQENILDKYPLQPYTPNSFTDRDAFSLALAKIREDGYFVGREHSHKGIGGVSAPVRDYTRGVVAALGVAVPISLLDEPRQVAQLVKQVRDTGAAISADLGYLRI